MCLATKSGSFTHKIRLQIDLKFSLKIFRKIENLDELENLIIFSAGNNIIDTKDGVNLTIVKKLS